ncbi:Ni/Fe hydrogenase subunit alpha [Thiorhodovibrio frisius]|uniref:Coenzyme F420-reducing hydrogenase, alpha subunit n=1 Tax=Thiorhodovibrio frisius TaxID=631362 RepID=H8Z5K0_9GAMM|nr:Ni/Fe hydrogenase subunit alpha [Thiorhodovibrio frisius]EIC20570.1 coenzyme F420-reducing hydrogenase, alpha subunit [Thiorhodovibrio frisius]WPL21318.1 NAD-reducing hydrogenase HoxS subunit beta [Thiorhodovibrio frisius]
MSRTITIEPVTRIEGHARISLQLADTGEVEDARFHLTQFRGFEKFCEGRPYREMPALTARTCGICPVSHLLASNKACDDLLAVTIPPTAEKLRQVMNLAQLVQSHALSFFHLSSPDLLLGWDADPQSRNVFGVMQQYPELAKDGIRLRQIGQTIIEILGGKKIHPTWVVPGGVSEALSEEKHKAIQAMLPEGLEIAKRTYATFKTLLPKFKDEASHFGSLPTLFLSLVSETGQLEHTTGLLRVKDAQGRIIEDKVPPRDYKRLIGEAVEDFSYMKFPYYKPMGYPRGIYRVGPLARLNNADSCGTPYADVALAEFHTLQEDSGPVASSFHYHYARLVEIIYAIERMQRILKEPDILNTRVRAHARGNRFEGIGVSEAPRGTLMHHYKIDENGLITWVDLIIATGHNNLAMNRSIKQVADAYVDGNKLNEGMLNRVEAVIRCYDPCLSCASHAFGQMPLVIELKDAAGQVIDRLSRD